MGGRLGGLGSMEVDGAEDGVKMAGRVESGKSWKEIVGAVDSGAAVDAETDYGRPPNSARQGGGYRGGGRMA